jgi:hypothetical protein
MSRLQPLTDLRSSLHLAIACNQPGPETDTARDKFCHVFDLSLSVLGIGNWDAAKIFQVSHPTIVRWRQGKTAPHPIGRIPVLRYLLDEVENRIAVAKVPFMISELVWRGRVLRVHPTNPLCLTDGVWRVEYNTEHDDWSSGLCSRRFALGSYGKTAEEALEKHRGFCLLLMKDLGEGLK